jgi:Fe-S cluster biogenesis protein NfuA
MQSTDIRILAEPLTTASCRFSVDRPVYPEASYFFSNQKQAEDSPLANRLFAIEGVVSVLIAHDQVTVSKSGQEEWTSIGRRIGAAIREFLATGLSAVSESLRSALPPEAIIRDKVQCVLDADVNPGVASHGGFVRLIDVKSNNIYIQMGGGCQGCGMAMMTLKHGVETAIRRAVPEVGGIFDTTDHASGRNPFFASSKDG